MRCEILRMLCCPLCRASLEIEAQESSEEIGSGHLNCQGCTASFAIEAGIPRFVSTEAYVSSFGQQWNRYNVELPAEDREVFEAKTGFSLDQLDGKWLLDAGCGGGRYSALAAAHGAKVVAVDMSRAVDRASRRHAGGGIQFLQADLLSLPLRDQQFDLAFSMGVLHHSADPHGAFKSVAATVRCGGKLAIWLYRRNTRLQEWINNSLRRRTVHLNDRALQRVAVFGALLGGVPLLNKALNKLVNFSSHPLWVHRVCDTYDWYSPSYQSHHTVAELLDWFVSAEYERLQELGPVKKGRVYRWAYHHDLIIGSGVNVVGVRRQE